VIDGLLTGYVPTDDIQANAQILASYIDVVQNGANLEFRIERDGAVATASELALLVTFTDTAISSMNGATTSMQALYYMLTASSLMVI
jgi:hypothetical protein